MFKVAVMSYWNTLVYVQWITDRILQSHCDYFCTYVNDIVIFSATLKKHLHHLQSVFQTFFLKSIYLLSEKFFLEYLSVQLLNQQVDTLDLATVEMKLAVIMNLEFSCTLTQLEKYLRMTGYLHQYISHYVIIIKSLQLCKILLNQRIWKDHDTVSNKSKKKRLASNISVAKSIFKELNTFQHLQTLFARSLILSHFNFKHQLYINLNISKEFRFDVHVYYTKQNDEMSLSDMFTKSTSESMLLMWSVLSSSQKNTESILFLSCLLTDTETQYWSTELEIVSIVWVVKKVHHMIEVTEQIMIIYTDHFITVFIVQQSSLNIINIEKLNLHLICASEYLQHFHLNVQYKSGRMNIVLNTLSQLISCKLNHSKSDKFSLDVLHMSTVSTYANSLIKVSSEFHQHILHSYTVEPHWQHIINRIKQNDVLDSKNTALLLYVHVQDLLYYKNIKKSYCLCIFSYLYGEVFALAHNSMRHSEYTCTHKRLTDSLYLSDLLKCL